MRGPRRVFYPVSGAAVKLFSGVTGSGSSSHLPATDILVPQQAQVPIIARRPFFISVRVAESISCLARQRTQYPITLTSSAVPEINPVKVEPSKNTGMGNAELYHQPGALSRHKEMNIWPEFGVLKRGSFSLCDME